MEDGNGCVDLEPDEETEAIKARVRAQVEAGLKANKEFINRQQHDEASAGTSFYDKA